MGYEAIILDKKEKIAIITLNRPRVLNAVSEQMLNEIQSAVSDIKDDTEIKVAIFRGAGERAFSAGIDIKESVQRTKPIGPLLHATFSCIRFLPKPVVCAVNGYCIGAGLEIMLSTDMVIATDVSQFSMPEINLGTVSFVEAALLSKAMGIFKAKEMCLTGEYFDAQKAERAGLVNEVVPVSEFDARVDEVVKNLASKDATALAVQKDIINKWMTTDLETAIDYSIVAIEGVHKAPGRQEGMATFLDKKKTPSDRRSHNG